MLRFTKCNEFMGSYILETGEGASFEAAHVQEVKRTGSSTLEAEDASAGPKTFREDDVERLSAVIILDVTNFPEAGSVPSQIAQLKQVVFDQESEDLLAQLVLVECSEQVPMLARLTSLDIHRSLFGLDGTPRRAVLNLSMVRHQRPREVARDTDKTPVDLTHIDLDERGISDPE